ncbi:MAG TPA: HAMP domain-containing sensor histidine kinase [Cyclobacteriaceae bacterium]
MISVGILFLASLLLLVIILQVRAYYILKRQNKVITDQSLEISKQNQVLGRQNQLLNDLNSEKQLIIGVVSHDLKGPFNRIFALSQLLNLSSKNLTDEQKGYVARIHQIAVDGLNMVRNLLDTRKLEDRGIDMTLESIQLEPFVSSFVKNYQTVAEEKKIDLIFQSPSNISVIADRLFLNRVLDNLLSNAVKFSMPKKKVTVSIDKKDDQVHLAVKDEGLGITKEDQKKLYQKFQRLTAKPTAGESSTGLGLSIVKALTEKMGGTIKCESKEGEGTKFIVSLKSAD